jgi:hypothetical protein
MGWNAWQAWTTWEWMASKVVQEIGALGTSVWQKYILCPNEHYPKKWKHEQWTEETTKGSRRPVGGFEKATSKKKRNTNDTAQVQPQDTSTV